MKRRKFTKLLFLGLITSIAPVYWASAIADWEFQSLLARELPTMKIFYVATNGSDRYSGTLAEPNDDLSNGPFATIQQAQQAIRQLKQQQGGVLQQPVTVMIREGTYYLSEPLIFTNQDSGTAAYPITYQAYGNEKPIISGGRKIVNWQRQGHLWVAKLDDVAQGNWHFRLLRVGNNWAIRARYPNYNPQKPLTGGWLIAQQRNFSSSQGSLNTYIAQIGKQGNRVHWNISVPQSGKYQIWLRYARRHTYKGSMSGKTAISVNRGDRVSLNNLPNTGGWERFEWAMVGTIDLDTGSGVLEWENLLGGGINLDAFCFSDDLDWKPTSADNSGHLQIPAVSPGKHQIIIHAETYSYTNTQDLQIISSQRYRIPIASQEFPNWQNWQGAEVHAFLKYNYGNAIFPIAQVDRENQSLMGNFAQSSYYIAPGCRFFIENVFEALDSPNEWYLNHQTGELFYWAETSEFPNLEVVAPVLDKLIVLQGDQDSEVEYLNFQSLTFKDTDYTIANNYFLPNDAAIWLKFTRYCQINNCQFETLGGYGSRLEDGSHHNQLVGNQICRLGQGGFILRSKNTNAQPHHNLIAGNQINHCGLIYKHIAGIYLSTGSYNQIAHNHICNLPRYGISLKSFDHQNYSHNNLVEFNRLEHLNLETCDTGAIETLGRDKQLSHNMIRFNLIRNVVGMGTTSKGAILSPYYCWGIYLDDFSSGTTVYGNIIIDTVLGSVMLHGGKNNLIENNIFINGQKNQIQLEPKDDSMQENIIRRNLIVYKQPEASLVKSSSQLWNRKILAECDFNVYWCNNLQDLAATTAAISPEGSFAQWQAAGFDRHSLIANPSIVDWQKGNYKLMPDSPAFDLNFRPIPTHSIGSDNYQLG